MPTATLAPPNGELVAQAWLAVYAGIPAAQIAGRLTPTEQWANDGFLTVRALPAGVVHTELTERRGTIVTLDAWAARKTHTVRPLWGVAATMLERVRIATFRDNQQYGKRIEMPVFGYQPARVLSAYLTSEPRRIDGDPSGFARMTVDLAVDWTA